MAKEDVVLKADGERWRVLARKSKDDPFYEVESILGRDLAEEYAEDLRYYDTARIEGVDEAIEDGVEPETL